jgi:hypothetical protein
MMVIKVISTDGIQMDLISDFSITDKNSNINHSTVFINTDDNTNFNVCFVDWIHRSSTAEQDIQLKIGKLLSRFGDVSK